MKRAAIYLRTATARDDTTFTLDAQEHVCRTYATANGYEVIELISDAGMSGATLNRPGLMRLRTLASQGRIDAVIVTSLDRLTRRAAHALLLHDELKRAGVAVYSVDGKDATDATAQVIRSIYEEYITGVGIEEIVRRLTTKDDA
jgi:site-specific DNA recombinase